MDLDPDKSLSSQTGGGNAVSADVGPPLKDDPEYSKVCKTNIYFFSRANILFDLSFGVVLENAQDGTTHGCC